MNVKAFGSDLLGRTVTYETVNQPPKRGRVIGIDTVYSLRIRKDGSKKCDKQVCIVIRPNACKGRIAVEPACITQVDNPI